MALPSSFTRLLGIEHPIALAPMSGSAGGTRFEATLEAQVSSSATKAILEARGDDTDRSGVLDIALGSRWPRRPGGTSSGRASRDDEQSDAGADD